MEQLKQAIRQMISISEEEMTGFLEDPFTQTFKRREFLSVPGKIADEIFFINQGIIRVLITDIKGIEHTPHFALENQFIADYSSFLRMTPARYSLQALEETEAVVLPHSAIEWGYRHLWQGDKLGRFDPLAISLPEVKGGSFLPFFPAVRPEKSRFGLLRFAFSWPVPLFLLPYAQNILNPQPITRSIDRSEKELNP